jgi:cobalt-zinc-cadmium efflux system membrane fusion protein
MTPTADSALEQTWLATRRAAPIALLFLSCLLVSCGPEASAVTPAQVSTPEPDTVRISEKQTHQIGVVKVEPKQFRLHKQAIGQIAFNEDASTVVLTPFSGRVTRVLARIGDDMKRGEPLFEIDSPEVATAQTELVAAVHALNKARSQLALARRVFDRQENLLRDKAAAQREVDQARHELGAAESDFKTAEGALIASRNRLRVIMGRDDAEIERVERDRTINPLITINAPIDGTVVARKIGPGQYVRADAGEPLYSIVNLSTMWLKAFVAEADIPFVRAGQEIEVKIAALPNRVFKARIIAVGAASDQGTRRLVVRSEIPNEDGVLKADMFATFKITISNGEPAPAVPVNAVIREGDDAFLWVETKPLSYQRRKIKAGLEQDGKLQVLGGLQVDDSVVGRGSIFLDTEWRQ